MATKKITERMKMKKHKKNARRIIAISLALIMFLGSVFATEPTAAFQPGQSLAIELEAGLRAELSQIVEIGPFSTELVDLSHWQLEDNELTELPPEALEAFLREQEAYFAQNSFVDFYESALDINETLLNFDELDRINEYRVEDFNYDGYQAIAPMSEFNHDSIVGNPFALRFNANDSVSLNTGASNYRVNILNLPGRNGFDFSLDLVYSSSRAYTLGARGLLLNSDRYHPKLGEGWMFDLPYMIPLDRLLYIPGRGTFETSNLRILNNPLDDMRLSLDSNFISGSHTSRHRLMFYNGTSYFFDNQGRIIGKVDRFGNTIRFEYANLDWLALRRQMPSRIIDTNGKVIMFRYTTFPAPGWDATSGTITITGPDGSNFRINVEQTVHLAFRTFLLSSIQNQAGAVTTFSYQDRLIRLNSGNKDPYYSRNSRERGDVAWLLTQVNYPSGAQVHFAYDRHTINFSMWGSRHVWKVSSRELRYNEREYLRTIFGYEGCHTGFPQIASRPPLGHTYSTTVIQNNGLRTVYTFNHRHMNILQRTYNALGTLLSEQTRVYDNERFTLPISVEQTEHKGAFSRSSKQYFSYNNVGQVTQAISPLAQGSTHERYRTDYTYDGRFGLPLTRTSRPDAQTTVVERNVLSADGRSVIRSYVYENNVQKSRTDFTHDTFGNVTEIREFYANNDNSYILAYITYNSGTRPSMIRRTSVRDASGTLIGNIDRHFTYDAMWRILSETDPNGYITKFQYDGLGRITRIDFPSGGFATYAYDDRQNTLTHRTALGATYIYQYDGLGNLSTITANGTEILRNIHDNRKRVIETRNAQGITSSQRTTFTYDILDRVIERRSLNPQGSMLYRETIAFADVFNAEGNRRVTTTVVGTVATGSAPNIQTFVQYDNFGRRTQEGVIGGGVVTYTHDLAGRVITEQLLGVNNTFTYNVHGLTSVRNILDDTASNTYDMLGRLVTSTDFMGNVQRFTYDTLGRLLTHHVPFERSGTTVRYAETRYFYDRNSNLTRQSNLINIPGQAQVWASTNNAFAHNRLISSETGGSGGIRTTYTYDLAGNVLTKTVGDATTTFTYNNRGQLVSITDALGQIETFAYDANGNLITHIDRNGTTFQMSYDNLGRMVHKEAQQNGIVTDFRSYAFHPTGALRQVTNGDHIITYYYDAQGRLRRQTETGGIVKTFAYNLANNLTQSRVYVGGALESSNVYTFDTAQRLETVITNGELIATYTYNANNQRTSTVSSNNLTTTYTHNLAGLITNLTNRHGNTFLSSFDYLYYLDGNTRQVTENLNGSARIITYTYDLARRLTREQTIGTDARTEAFTFDNRGNRVSRTVTGSEDYTVTYVLDLNNRLLTSTRTPTGGTAEITTFSYDNNGNQLTKTVGGMTETKTYNAFNQLISVYIPAKEKTAITSADINVIAPIIGTELSNIATGTGNFSISPVTWSPNDTIASANTSYTATVTLTANAGYTFEGLEAATINGNPAIISENTGIMVRIAYTFAEEVSVFRKNQVFTAGGSYTVALKSDGTVWAWGINNGGALGDGTFINRRLPVQVQNLRDIANVAGGTFALREDDSVFAWGTNQHGRLGDGTTITHNIPVKIPKLSNVAVVDIASSLHHTVALKEDGTVWTWGLNDRGQLGNGTLISHDIPAQVPNLTNITAVAVSNGKTFAVREDGTVWTWGVSMLANNFGARNTKPVQMPNLVNIIAISAGANHAVALKEDGTVWAWGVNFHGALGDGTTICRDIPVQVPNFTDVVAVQAGLAHTMALKNDGTVWAWGWNDRGQLGDGTTITRNTPVRVQGLANITSLSIASTAIHAIALSEDGYVWTWGNNTHGQLGDGTTIHRTTPVQVRTPDSMGRFNLLDVAFPQALNETVSNMSIGALSYMYSQPIEGEVILYAFINFDYSTIGIESNQSVSSIGYFTICDITWSHCNNAFGTNTVYTVNVTLIASDGFTFDGLLLPMINGAFATVICNNGTSVTLSLEFSEDAKTMPGYLYEYNLLSDNTDYLFEYEYDVELNEYDNMVIPDDRSTIVVDQESYTITYAYNLNSRLLGYARNENQTRGAFNETMLIGTNEIARADDGEFNQLTKCSATGIIATYTYRADGLRAGTTKTIMGSTGSETITTTHVWSKGHIVLELDGSGAIINRFDRGIFGELLRSEQHGFYLFNKRGDVVQRVDANGGIIRNYRYTAFGVELDYDAKNSNPFRFASMYWDAHTQTYMTPHRNLNPRLGRWTSADPFFWGPANIFASPMEAANLFVFVMNNPVMWTDPLGLFAWNERDDHIFQLRYEVDKVAGASIDWDASTSTATVNIWDISVSFNTSMDGVSITDGRMSVRADTFYSSVVRAAGNEMVFLGGHGAVVRGNFMYHTMVVMFVTEGSTHHNTRDFTSNGTIWGAVQYATIGGTSTGFGTGYLRSAINMTSDVDLSTKRQMHHLHSGAGMIDQLFTAHTHFNTYHYNVPYALTPVRLQPHATISQPFNSNSLAHGMISSVGLSAQPWRAPGWNLPVPTSFFGN